MKPVTDPEVLRQLGSPVADPAILAQLEGGGPVNNRGVTTDTGSPALESLLQGATFGFSDELQAGMKGLWDYGTNKLSGKPADLGELYGAHLGNLQDAQSAYRQQHPAGSMAGEIAGGAATGLLGAGKVATSQALSGLPKLGRYAMTGAGAGAASGAGFSDPGERLAGAAMGGTIGAGIGVALPAMGAGARGIYRKTVDAARGPASTAQRKLAEAIGRDSTNPKEIAQNLKKLGPGATITDAGGANVLDLGKNVAMIPGKAKDKAKLLLDTRQEGQSTRLLDMFKKTLSPEDFRTQQAAIIESARTKAAPFYKEAYNSSVEITPKLNGLLKRPAMKSALTKARRLAADDGVDLPDDNASVQVLDYAKRALDDKIRTVGKSTNQGRILTGLKNDLLGEVDSQAGAYKTARALYAGDIAARDALDSGYDYITGTKEIKWGPMLDSFKSMSDAEKDMFRLGSAQALKDKVMNTPLTADGTKKIFNTPAMREKLKLIFPDKRAMDDFVGSVGAESTFNETRATVLKGSRTEENRAGVADLMTNAVGLGEDVAQGNWLRAAMGFFRNKANGGLPEPVRNELAEVMFTDDPAKNRAFLENLTKRVARKELSEQQAQQLGALVSSMGSEGAAAGMVR